MFTCSHRTRFRWLVSFPLVLALTWVALLGPAMPRAAAQPVQIPELTGGGDWFGIDKPLTLKELRGKLVLIDFWTLCCVNCLQTLPELAKLETKYAKQLVVIGVHSPKFENERSVHSVRQAIHRYEISHPVLNDPDRNLWRSFAVRGWPTLILIDPEGGLVGRIELERPKMIETLEAAIIATIRIHRAKLTLNEELLPFQKAQATALAGPLRYPGKVMIDEVGKRIFIADSTHHRVVITDMAGKHLDTIGKGTPGKTNGSFEKAQFDDPQGMALRGSTLYIADRKNHMVRAADLKTRTVRIVAGNGKQGYDMLVNGPGTRTTLNSPWDLLLRGSKLIIANAGSHQLRVLDLDRDNLSTWVGTTVEDIIDGPRLQSALAQPSGLTTDGTNIYWADSETSSVRCMPLDGKGMVRTIIGKGLFIFGDQDGGADQARLQHPLGVVYADHKLYVTDTYNSKIKIIEPEKLTSMTMELSPADPNETGRLFDEPGGIDYYDGKLYVADTNAHRIRIVDINTHKVSTLALTGVEPPKPDPK